MLNWIKGLFRKDVWVLVDATFEVEISEAVGPMPWKVYFRQPGGNRQVLAGMLHETHLQTNMGILPMADPLAQQIYAIIVNHQRGVKQ